MRSFAYEVGRWADTRREGWRECGRFRLVISGAEDEFPSCEGGGVVDEAIVAAILEATREGPAGLAFPMAVPKLAVSASRDSSIRKPSDVPNA